MPIYGAIQRNIDDKLCLLVDNEEIIPQIEEFIAALERRSYKRKPFDWRGDEKKIQDGFRNQIEIFAHHASIPSLRFMRDFLARWNKLHRDPEGRFIADETADKAKGEAASSACGFRTPPENSTCPLM